MTNASRRYSLFLQLVVIRGKTVNLTLERPPAFVFGSLKVKSQYLVCPLQHMTLSFKQTLLIIIISCKAHSTLGLDIDILHHKIWSQAA